MYFLNGLAYGFITGLTCCLLSIGISDNNELTKQEQIQCETGFYIGLAIGLTISIIGIIYAFGSIRQ